MGNFVANEGLSIFVIVSIFLIRFNHERQSLSVKSDQ